jgi:hypothetical protein
LADRRTPLPIKRTMTTADMSDYLIEMATRVNQLDDHVMQLDANYLRVAGETAKAVQEANDNTTNNMNRLTKAIEQLREALVPNTEVRKQMITLPDLSEVVHEALEKEELRERRQNSERARADNKDVRMARMTAYWGLAIGLLVELFTYFLMRGK